jgi:putative Holliday junction resolvase
MRIVGIDFGERRIGVAAADDRTRIAIPVTTIEIRDDPVGALAKIVEDQLAEELVIGLPVSLSGTEGPQAQRVREVADALAQRIDIPIHFHDERLTSVEAARGPDIPRGRKKKPSLSRDAAAAAILLQAYIDGQKPYG